MHVGSQIKQKQRTQVLTTQALQQAGQQAGQRATDQAGQQNGRMGVRKLFRFVNNPDGNMYRTRLSTRNGIANARSTSRVRCTCILCCTECNRGGPHSRGRVGRQTTGMCTTCRVYLCKDCWTPYHTQDAVNIAPCLLPRRSSRSTGASMDEDEEGSNDEDGNEDEGDDEYAGSGARPPRRRTELRVLL